MSATGRDIWLTVGEALRITKLELEPFLQDVVDKWYSVVLDRMRNNGIGVCTNPTSCNNKQRGDKCVSCKAWCDEIERLHQDPQKKVWKNADCTCWASEAGAWEVAKVFMSSLGDRKSKVVDAESTDIQGLMNLLHHLPREAYPSVKIDVINVCLKYVVNARNNWAHAPQHELTTDEKKEIFVNLLTFSDHLKLAGVDTGKTKNLKSRIQTLEKNEITNVSKTAISCLWQKELAHEMQSDLSILKSTSSDQGQDINQLETKFEGLRKLFNNSRSDMIKKEDFETLKTEVKVIMSKLEQLRLDRGYLKSCIPEKKRNIFGRDKAIKEIADLIMEDKPCVVLTGGPGFGKTTVANQVAHELKSQRVVLCFNLWDVHSINNICTMILNSVGRNPKEMEVEELMHWSATLNQKVVLVLDNLENALQSDRDKLCKLLEDCRTNSRSNLQFLITSREKFALSDMEISYKIEKLTDDEGIHVIRSTMSEPSCAEEKLLQLAVLCEGIPLALLMVGSIIDIVDIDDLIKELDKDPLKTLENSDLPEHHRSIKKVIECSFNKLRTYLKEKLVQLSVFRRSFDQNAVCDIWKETSKTEVAKTLKELTHKSLLEMIKDTQGTPRYQLHPFIQKYLQDVKGDEYKEKLNTAEKEFMTHFISKINRGNDLFWSRDKFMASMKIFKDDTFNIGKAIDMCCKRNEIESIVLNQVRRISFYLEMCISFQKLEEFLQLCLKVAVKQTNKCSEIEVHCLIAYYEGKKGNDDGQALEEMKAAESLYKEVESQLTESQKWFYLHSTSSRSRFAQQWSDAETRSNQLDQARKKAFEACEQLKDQNNPERALTLGLLGNIEKGCHHNDEAEKYLRQCLNERTKFLGKDHFLTAVAQKQLADMYSVMHSNTEALEFYELSLDTYKRIQMETEKQCIYLMKNMAFCHKHRQEHLKAIEYAEKALKMAESVFLDNCKLKVELYILLATIEMQRKNYSEAEKWLTEGLNEKIVKSLGEDHISTAMLQKHLADLYLEMERYQDALNLYKQILPVHEKSPNQRLIVYAIKNMASCYMNLEKWNEAWQYADEALEIAKRSLPHNYKLIDNLYSLNEKITMRQKSNSQVLG